MIGASMLLASILLANFALAADTEVKLESIYADNPDRTFRPVTRSALQLSTGLEHKRKAKYSGAFLLLRTKLDYQHDFEVERLRQGEASATLLAVKPLKELLLGGSLAAGHLWRWRRDFNVNTGRFGEIDGDHFFTETRLFVEKKLSQTLAADLSLAARLEDYASTYSLYVKEENDNISSTLNGGVTYKDKTFEVKPAVSYSRKWWRERRALSSRGFFVAAGEPLRPDRIDTLTATLRSGVKLGAASATLTPGWTKVNDLNNDGRSWSGPSLAAELMLPVSSYGLKVRADWSKRDYDTQLSTFQSMGQNKLAEESRALLVSGNRKLGQWLLEVAHKLDRSTSNQTDFRGREIGKIAATTSMVSLQKTF